MTALATFIYYICGAILISIQSNTVLAFTPLRELKPVHSGSTQNSKKPDFQSSADLNSLQTQHNHVNKSVREGSVRGGTTKIAAWPLNKDPKGMAPDYPLAFARIGITIGCTFLTWYAQSQYSSVMASSALTLICSMIFDKRLGQAAFCGSFAGMCSSAIIPSWSLAISLGAATSFLFEALIHYQNAYLGVGGRLGMTAFLATSLITAISNVSTGFSLNAISLQTLQSNAILSFSLWHAIGSVATIVLREASDDSAAADPVRASAVVGLAGALLLKDKTAALALYGGSFVGMSLPSRLMYGPNSSGDKSNTLASLLFTFAVAGALGGVIHAVTNSFGWWLGGWGGKAGTCAFLGCLLYRGIRKSVGTAVAFTK